MKISSIAWGDDSAERDAYLLDYFVSLDSFARLEDREKGIVIGRKGSGKSALLKRLEQIFQEEDGTYVIKVSPRYNSIRAILNDGDLSKDGFGQEVFFQHTWLRQIYLDALCCVGHKGKGKFSQGSLEFCRQIATQQNRTSKDLVENISDIMKKVKLKVGNLGEFGLQLEQELRDVADVDALEHHMSEICKDGAKFVVLIDDLDVGWDNSGTANNMLLGLLLASNSLSGRFSKNVHSIIFLREDVYSILMGKTQHSDKYRNIERLRWNKDGLLEILKERIKFNFERVGEQLPPDLFLKVFPSTVGTANADNWMIDRTLSRPRELLQLARYYTEAVAGTEPSDQALKDAESDYSNWKLDDLCAEYSNQYPGLVSLFSYWKTKFFRQKYHLKRQEIEDFMLSLLGEVAINDRWFSDLSDRTDINGLLKVLYEIGFIGDFVLGGQGGSKTYYSYEGRHEPIFEEVQIHPCFRRAVNTVERIRS